MVYFLFVLSIIVIALALSVYLREHFMITLPVAVLLLIFFLYMMGLLGILQLSMFMFFGLTLLSLVYLIFNVKNKQVNIKKELITPGFIIFITFVVLNFIFNFDRFMIYYDEFSHWGLVVKNMYIHNDFGNSPLSTVAAKHYPPGSPLFLYLLSSLDCCFRERNLYLAFNILQVSLLLPFLKVFDMNQIKQSIVPAIIVLSIPLILYHNNYSSLYPDILLGILFAYILFVYFTGKEITASVIVNLSLAFIVLVLFKRIGIYFAFLAMLIIIADVLFTGKIKENKRVFLLLIPAAAAVLSYVSWETYVSLTTSVGASSAHVVGSALATSLVFESYHGIPGYWIDTIKEFVKHIIPYLYKAVYFAMACFFIYKYLPGKTVFSQKSLIIYASGIILGFSLYSLIMLFTYLTSFSESEARNVASFSRYMHSYIAGAALSLSYFLLMIDQKIVKEKKAISVFILILITISLIFPAGISFFGTGHAGYQEVRAELEETKQFPTFMEIGIDNIYFISQATHDINYWIFRFNVTPIGATNRRGWTISTDQKLSSHYYIIDAERWANMLLNDFTYLYIYRADAVLVDHYGEYFENTQDIRDMKLFKVESRDGKPLLVAVDKKTGVLK